MVPVLDFPSPRDVTTQCNNEPRPKYFKFGMELIFRKPWNFLASSLPTHEVGARSSPARRRVDTERTQTRHGPSTRRVTKIFVPPDRTFASFRRCDPVRGAEG